MAVVDTSVMIDYLAGRANVQTEWLDGRIDLQRIGITSLTLSEISQGVHGEEDFDETREALKRFAINETRREKLAVASARNDRRLRTMGLTIRNTTDSFVATFRVEEGHFRLHNDLDFDASEVHLGPKVMYPPARHPN